MDQKFLRRYAEKMDGLRPAESEPTTLGEAESEVLRILGEVARSISLVTSHSFGYHTPEDLQQMTYDESLRVLQTTDRYDFRKPLANYLWVHVRNRVLNLKRKQFYRSEAPCKCCDPFNPGPEPCDRWRSWHRRNASKQRLMCPVSLHSDANLPAPSPGVDERILMRELDEYISSRLPEGLLDEYRTFRDDEDMPKKRREAMQGVLRSLLEGTSYDPS